MMSITASITTRGISLVRPSIVAALSTSTPRQRWVKHSIHTLQQQQKQYCAQRPIKTSSRRVLLCNVESIQTIIGRRLLSSSGSKNAMNSKNTAKINSIKEASTKPATKGDAAATSKPFWKSFLEPKPMPERWTNAWYREMVLICTVFAITGSSTMILVRPAVANGLGLKGSMKDGPWSFRICSLVVMTPIYATLLVMVGTVFGRHSYFRHFSIKMWSRFGIPPEMIDSSYHITKKTFRKW